MISKIEFIRRFKEEYDKIVGLGDTKENREKYFENLDLEELYEIFVYPVT